MSSSVARRLSSLYDRRDLRSYVRWKVRADPAYAAVLGELRHSERPLIDLGCGIGLLPFYLREHGFRAPIIGIDFDERKIALARQAAAAYRAIDFVAADVREELPPDHDVVMLDVLHYLDEDSQRRMLANAASVAGTVIIRQGIRDGSWRYRLTRAVDAFGRLVRWMRADALTYPARATITDAFGGFEQRITPLWGGTPYNNYLFVFRRAAPAGITKE